MTIIGQEHWHVTKPAVRGRGLVATQHAEASAVGAAVLRDGGNAVDAAIATGLAIGAVEPWMSGLGSGGFMIVYRAAERAAWCVSFTMPSPRGLDPARFPLTGAQASDAFCWAGVVGDRNIKGCDAVGVPGLVAGLALALERFGTRSWSQSVAPALALAEQGMEVGWYATLKIATEAGLLRAFDELRRTYLPDGLPPAPAWTAGSAPRLRLGRLAETYRRLAEAGPRDFYEGEIARSIAADIEAGGGSLRADDLAAYRAAVDPALSFGYRGATIHGAPGLTAGPTLRAALGRLEASWSPGPAPDGKAYAAYADALSAAYAERLSGMGEGAERKGCTTHITVADGEGNLVALTQTLLYLFGSGVMLPGTGIMMNNAMAWFDPVQGRPNSLRPGRRPLTNMCPTVIERDGKGLAALGASGGRRIVPAVFQLASFVTDFRMAAEAAAHQPRIDVSGGDTIVCDPRLGPDAIGAIGRRHRTLEAQAAVYPSPYACPNVIVRGPDGVAEGVAFIASPTAAVVAA